MFNGNDFEQLSAYIDGALSASERADLEARLQTDPALRRELERLQATKALIGSLPQLSAPRDLRLTRAMVGYPVNKPRRSRTARILTSPAFSALSAAAAVILLVIGAGLFTLTSSQQPAGNVAAFSQVAGVPTNVAPTFAPPLPQGGASNNDEEAARDLTPGEQQAQLYAATGENAPNDQVFVVPAAPMIAVSAQAPTQAPTQAFESLNDSLELVPITPTAMGTSVMRFALSATEGAAGSGVLSQAQPSADQSVNNGLAALEPASAAQESEAPMMQSADAADAFAPSATAKPSVTPSPTPTATITAATTTVASATPLPTLAPVDRRNGAAGQTSEATIAIGLVVVAVLLFGVAVVTTLLRRRA